MPPNGVVDMRALRYQVLNLYKTLLYYGRDYPLGYKYFRDRCHRSFEKNKDETDPQQIQKYLSRGDFIIKELEALYRLKKYRYLKQKYYPDKQEEEAAAAANKHLKPGEEAHAVNDPAELMKRIKSMQESGK